MCNLMSVSECMLLVHERDSSLGKSPGDLSKVRFQCTGRHQGQGDSERPETP